LIAASDGRNVEEGLALLLPLMLSGPDDTAGSSWPATGTAERIGESIGTFPDA
jgi:hypothetical protein